MIYIKNDCLLIVTFEKFEKVHSHIAFNSVPVLNNRTPPVAEIAIGI